MKNDIVPIDKWFNIIENKQKEKLSEGALWWLKRLEAKKRGE